MVFSLSTGQRMLVIGLCRASHRNCHRSHCWQAVQVLCPNFVPHVGHNRFQRLAEIVRLQPNHYSQVCSDQHSARFHDCTTLHVLCPKSRIKRTQQNKNSIIIDAPLKPIEHFVTRTDSVCFCLRWKNPNSGNGNLYTFC